MQLQLDTYEENDAEDERVVLDEYPAPMLVQSVEQTPVHVVSCVK